MGKKRILSQLFHEEFGQALKKKDQYGEVDQSELDAIDNEHQLGEQKLRKLISETKQLSAGCFCFCYSKLIIINSVNGLCVSTPLHKLYEY